MNQGEIDFPLQFGELSVPSAAVLLIAAGGRTTYVIFWAEGKATRGDQ